jgi:hypothetical protein
MGFTMLPDPYRTQPLPERVGALPSPPSDLMVPGAFMWIVTLLRVVLGHLRAEPPGQEHDIAWTVLLVMPVLAFLDLMHRRRGA